MACLWTDARCLSIGLDKKAVESAERRLSSCLKDVLAANGLRLKCEDGALLIYHERKPYDASSARRARYLLARIEHPSIDS